jgi:hypothetical protein
MASLLYGSSNVYRNFDRAVTSGLFSGRGFQLVRCTKKTTFDSHLATLSSATLVFTSVLENFISDGCSGVPDDEVLLFGRQQITAHVESLFALVSRLPGVNAIVCPPMFRSVPVWFASYLPDFHQFLQAEVTRVGSSRIGVCNPFVVVPSLLEADGVHLSPAGGDRFMSHINAELQTMLVEARDVPAANTLPMPDAPEDRLSQILNVVNSSASRLDSIEALGSTVSSLVKSTSAFEAFARRRFREDDFIFARLKEEADAELNKSREDRVVITGLPPPPITVHNHLDKKRHYTEVVSRLIVLACVEADPVPKVTDVYINLRKDRGQPLVEVRLDTVSGAQLFRREGVRLAKEEQAEFVNLFFANSVTQATRVRIEVLKALAKKLTTTSESAYVQGFISRPVLQYRVKEGVQSTADGTGRSYNFVDSMSQFGSRLQPEDLTLAYVRAGSTFTGAMSQYFIVLEDRLVVRGGTSTANRVPLGRRGGRGGLSRRGHHPSRSGAAPGFGRATPREASPHVDAERGVKRAGEPSSEVPSKKNDITLIPVSE